MEARAGTSLFYNFQFIGNNGSVSGTFKVQGPGSGASYPYNIIGITGTVSGAESGNGSFDTIPYSQGNLFSPTNPYLDNSGIKFTSNGVDFNLYWLTTGSDYDFYNYVTENGSRGSMTVSGPVSQ